MTRRLCIDMNWMYGPDERRRYIDHAVVAEDAGVDTIFVAGLGDVMLSPR